MSVEYEQLIAFAAGELSGETARAIERELSVNPAAARTVELFRSVRETLQADDSVAPPADVVSRAQALFKPGPSSWATCLDALRRVVAELTFDSRPAAALAGLRGACSAHQLSYHSALADVDVQVERGADELCHVTGQVSPTGSALPQEVALVPRAGGDVVRASVEADGVFALNAGVGAYDLVVRFDNEALVLPDVPME